MVETTELKAWTRQRSGKGGARATRREGRIPGILYGDKKDPDKKSDEEAPAAAVKSASWVLNKPAPETQTQKTAAERGVNPCNTPDPG